MRAFAAKDLKLPVDGHYEKYADVHRPFVVWNVEAAPEFSLEAEDLVVSVCRQPGVSRLLFRNGARRATRRAAEEGLRRLCGGVEAYSTLGWFKDPVLNTFIFDAEPDLAETIFHELGHQRVFARGDTDFNEAFATTVGQEGARRWLRAKGDQAGLREISGRAPAHRAIRAPDRRTRASDWRRSTATSGRTQAKLKAAKKPRATPPEELRRQKQHLLDRLRSEYAQLKAQWGGNTEYDDWFARPLNNAQLNSVAAYYDLVPGFERLLAQNGGDLEKFYEAVDRLARRAKKRDAATAGCRRPSCGRGRAALAVPSSEAARRCASLLPL